MSASNGASAAPRAYVEIYPFEGGKYTVAGGNDAMLSLQVSKNIRAEGPGTFALMLAPGGPMGPNTRPQWLDILTPKSLVLIGLSRFSYQQIVMVGVIASMQETEVWTPEGVRRQIQVLGEDFQTFFAQANYYVLTLLSGSFNIGLGLEGSLSAIDPGLLEGSPEIMGNAWYKDIMAGPKGVMANTTFQYKDSRLTFFEMMGSYFQKYDEIDLDIPLGENFMTADGSWMQKFMQFFPFPWYEFFVTTAPVTQYAAIPGQQGTSLTMASMPGALPVSPVVVARVNPLPWTSNVGGTVEAPKLQMDFSKWDALPGNTLDTRQMQRAIGFSDAEVKNFYILNPLFFSNLFGVSNDQQSPFTYLFASWVDVASIHRYGFRPQVSEIHWFTDPQGAASKRLAANNTGVDAMNQMVGTLALKQTSYFEPVALMARGGIVTNLRPDIMIGTTITLQPFKDPEQWTFYVEGVTHSYAFGGPATTSLTLSRGLPSNTYSDDDMMLAIHTGNAMRQNGSYVTGLPPGLGSPLQPVNVQTLEKNLMAQIAAVFGTAGAK
jgi:hypothetical protein